MRNFIIVIEVETSKYTTDKPEESEYREYIGNSSQSNQRNNS